MSAPQVAAVLCLALVSPVWGNLQPCSPGPVGSCLLFGCSKSRGPATCVGHQCMCMAGYCRYPMSTIHVQSRKCRAQVPDSSCAWTHVCYKGGLLSSSCDRGICLCRSGMHIGPDGKCHSGWWPGEALLAMNSTERAEASAVELEEEVAREEEREVALNVLAFTALLSCPTALVSAGAALLLRKARQVAPAERSGYQKLPGGAAAGSAVTA